MPIPIRTVAITPYTIDAQLSRLARLVQRLTFIYSRTFSIRIAVLYIYIHICYYYMCMFIYVANWVAKWIFPIDVVDRRCPFHWWQLCSRLNFQIFQLTCLHYIRTQTQVHVCIRIFAYVCANFSVRIVISCSLSGGRSVPIATLFVRVRADLQAPSRGRCTWASRCCYRYYCRCCGCIDCINQTRQRLLI